MHLLGINTGTTHKQIENFNACIGTGPRFPSPGGTRTDKLYKNFLNVESLPLVSNKSLINSNY